MGVSFTIASVDVLTQVPDHTHTVICHPWIGCTGLEQALHGGISDWAQYNPSSEPPTPTPTPTMMIVVAFAPSTHCQVQLLIKTSSQAGMARHHKIRI